MSFIHWIVTTQSGHQVSAALRDCQDSAFLAAFYSALLFPSSSLNIRLVQLTCRLTRRLLPAKVPPYLVHVSVGAVLTGVNASYLVGLPKSPFILTRIYAQCAYVTVHSSWRVRVHSFCHIRFHPSWQVAVHSPRSYTRRTTRMTA